MATEQVTIVASLRDELSAGLQRAQREFKKIGTEAQKSGAVATAGLGRVGKAMDNTSRKAALFGDAYRSALDERHLRAFDIAGAALIGTFALAVTAAAGFDKQLSSLRAVTGATAEEMKVLSDAALKAGADTAFSASDAARAQTELARAGVSTADILGGALTGSLDLAAAGGLDLGRAAEIAASSMNMFGLVGSDVAMIADTLASGANKSAAGVDDLAQALSMGGTMASQLGMSIQETTGLLSMFADRGIKGSDAGTMLKTMLLRLTPTSAEAAAAMKDLGISGYDASGAFVGVADLAGQLQASLGSLSQEQRNAALTTIFGADAYRAAAILLDEGAAKVDEYSAAMSDQGAAARMASTMMDNLSGDLEQLKGSMETSLIRSGSGANDALRSLTQTATGLVNVIGSLPAPVLQIGLGLGALAGVLLLVVPRILALTQAMAAAGITAGSLKTRLGNVVGMVNPWTVGLAAMATAAVMYWQDVQRAKEAAQGFADTLDSTSGSKTEETYKRVSTRLGELITGADEWRTITEATGKSQADFIRIVAQGGPELDALQQRLDYLGSNGNVFAYALSSDARLFNAAGQSVRQVNDELKDGVNTWTTATQLALANGEAVEGVSTAANDAADDLYRLKAGQAQAAIESSQMAVALAEAEAAARDLSAALKLGNSFLSQRDAVRSYQAALDDFRASVKDNGKTFSENTAKGRDNAAALDAIASAAKDAYTATDDAGNVTVTNMKAYQDAAGVYYENARALGMSATEAAVLTSNIYGASVAASALSDKKVNPKVQADVKGLEGQLKGAQDKLAVLEGKPHSAKVEAKIGDAKAKITEIEDALSILKGKKTDPKVEPETDTAEQAIGRTDAALTDLDGKTATVYVDVVQRGKFPDNGIPGDGIGADGDTATSRARGPRAGLGSALARTLGKHSMVAASLGGGYKITNMLVGGGGRGHGSGDHQAGRALDVQGPRLGAYVQAVRQAGGFAELHGSGQGRHAHAVMGDTASPRSGQAVTGGAPVQVGPFYFTGVSSSDAKAIKATVQAGIREYFQQRRERGV